MANLKVQSAQEIRIEKQMIRQLDNDEGRAKIIETFAEIQEAEAKGMTQPSWENDENQEEYNFIFRNGQEFNVIGPTLEFAKNQCELFLRDQGHAGEDWEVFDVEITDLEEVKDRFYKAPVMGPGNSQTEVKAMPDVDEDFQKAFDAVDEDEDKKHYFKILEDKEGNVIGEVEVDKEGNELTAKKSKKKAAKKS
jgi:hypothetical protein|tara:strand:+ start:357 stop:938 length:582 start_codon:yes stop_codon:yes gene_type:complete